MSGDKYKQFDNNDQDLPSIVSWLKLNHLMFYNCYKDRGSFHFSCVLYGPQLLKIYLWIKNMLTKWPADTTNL